MLLRCSLSILLFILACNAIYSQTPSDTATAVPISVTISNNPQSTKFYLYARRKNVDSAVVTNGEFILNHTLLKTDPELVGLISSDKRIAFTFYIEQSPMMISVDLNRPADPKITGSKTNNDFFTYLHLIRPLEKSYDSIRREMLLSQNTDNNFLDSLKEMVTRAKTNFILQHPSSYFSIVCLLLETKRNNISFEESGRIFAQLDPKIRNSEAGNELLQLFKIRSTVSVGARAPVFRQRDLNGSLLTFPGSDGKWVLVEFWASWCQPCRLENPGLNQMLSKYKDKGFRILGVSLDENKSDWMRAIKQDSLEWIHVSDLKGWLNEVALIYGINRIPQNVLVDPNGIVIAMSLRSYQLEKILNEKLKDK